jgi:large subunit ribosomal protein L47
LKEKNKLKSDFLMCKQMQQIFYGFHDLGKVRLTMSRLLTVVNERKRLRTLYRIHLENEYIAEKKALEQHYFMVQRQEALKKGLPVPLLPHELKQKLQEREVRKNE